MTAAYNASIFVIHHHGDVNYAFYILYSYIAKICYILRINCN
jgi:hypothetical protein